MPERPVGWSGGASPAPTNGAAKDENMHHARFRILQEMPIFGGLEIDTLRYILHLSPILTIKEGSFFFHEEQKGGSMYVLEQGKVAVLKTWESKIHLLAYLCVGDCFGEMELLDLCPRAASVMAITDCTAIQISTANLFSLYKENLEQFTLIQMNMGREISRRLRQLDQELFAMQVDAQANHDFFLPHEEIIERGLQTVTSQQKGVKL
jgi:CRP-like cAMP-binding protein